MLTNNNPQEEEISKKSFFTAKFIDPQSIIEQLDLKEEMIVADFGSGAGYFTLPIAKKIENGGTIYALDVISQKLESVVIMKKLSRKFIRPTKKNAKSNPLWILTI